MLINMSDHVLENMVGGEVLGFFDGAKQINTIS